MALRKYKPSNDAPPLRMAPLNFSNMAHEKAEFLDSETDPGPPVQFDIDIDLREVYFLIMHFLSAGPCHRTYGQFWNELLEHQLLPRRHHAWYSRSGAHSGDENDNDSSLPLSYNKLVERYPHIETDHLVKLLKQLISSTTSPLHGMPVRNSPNAADVPTLLGSGSFSLLGSDRDREDKNISRPPSYERWPHMRVDQVRGLSLREIGGGFAKHHRAPSVRAACYAIAKPSTMVQKMQNIKKLRGHRDAVYCATFDRSGRYVVTGSDDRLVKIWSMETAFCLAGCRGHEGDITDLAVSSNNAWVASASNDCIIRVWRLPDGMPVAVLRGHTGAVTAIAFSPRPGTASHLLSSSDDGTCRIWDIRNTNASPRIYIPKPSDVVTGKSNGPSTSTGPSASTAPSTSTGPSTTDPPSHQILCCAYNASGTVFVTGSSDTYARVWNALKSNTHDCEQPNYEMDVLSGHENDVNYVQFSGCAVASRTYINDTSSEENVPKFKNSCFTQDNIVTCSRDGSAIIWVPRSRRSHSKVGRWTRAYHLKVPPPPLPPQPPRGGPRQRFVPIPRGVNMIVWSLDNRFVLAAIMDCRICVWNAVDGSLVHSLTGHSESTYVLDVHPFNPRIAMSAGYDGKTIIWDIWEGTPIQIYEIGRFKLVDGKFSPDGTSIILSDDVGQICILNTGQGESQKDAKYDQFFLGDYRPLIQDTHGNVLDQESQLPPYRRNIQDLLCDSSMMPYSEPYQSMFQQRRLGALGIERRFPSLKFAVGPVEIGGLQDYQMLPLPDLDRMIEPMPEFIDAMDWEPEIEVHSDDNDSEYNVTDDCSSEGGQGSFRTVSSGDTDCSVDDSDVEHSKNGLRKSKRKKHKVEFTTSSGRRVKSRNLDERDSTPSLTDRTKRSRSGKKSSRRRSSMSNSSRPQRVAARNARNFFSRITGVSTDEDEETPESEPAESESMLQDSDNQSNDSNRSMQNEKEKIPKGQEVFVDNLEEEIEIAELHKSEKDARNKRMKVVKFSLCDSTKPEAEKRIKIVGSSSKSSQETFEVNRNCGTSEGPGCSSGDLISAKFAQNHNTEVRLKMQSDKVENSLNLSAGYQGNEIRWGEVKARTTKHLKFGAQNLGSISKCDEHRGIENHVNGHLIPESECIAGSSHPETCDTVDGTDGKAYKIQQQYSRPGSSEGLNGARNDEVVPPEYVQQSILLDQSAMDDNQHKKGSLNVFNRKHGKECMDQSGPREIDNYVESHEVTDVCHDATRSAFDCNSHPDHYQELRDDISSISTKLRLRSRKIQEEPSSSSKLKYFTPVEDRRSSECDLESQSPSHMENEEWSEVGKSEAQVNELSKLSKNLYTEVNNKRYNAVYTRCKSSRTANASKNCGGDMDESTSNDSSNYVDLRMKFTEATADVVRRTRSMSMKATTTESNGTSKLRDSNRSVETSRRTEKNFLGTHEQLLGKECEFISTMTVGLRSTRNRRGSCYANQTPVSKRKTRQSFRKLSWLMLLEHEENYRYIPQLGDEVVYLRQGHQGYIESSRSSEQGPWRKYKSLKAVEFCKVEYLDYSTFPGSGESCCKIKLEFVDPSSSVFGDTFSLTLPELRDFSDFLVERTRYDAAISRNWTKRDKCRVWWYNSEEGGNWWDGRIVSVQLKSPEFPDSPWEKYTVQYKSDAGQIQQHSPWELHDYDTHWKHPQIDDEIRNKVLSLFAKLQQSGGRDQDPYGLQKLEQVTQKSDFLNRFPVSLSLEVIQVRLEQNYYRTLEAVKHDFTVMLSNAQRYFTKNTDLTSKMGRLSEWFNKKLLPL